MLGRILLVAAAWLVVALVPAAAQATGVTFQPGAPGIGDPYFPLAGNGGYDVEHYDLTVAYDPPSDVLRGLAKLDVEAKQNLSSFNLDLVGLNVRAIFVDGRPARWSRDEGELTITPRKGIKRGADFDVLVAYDGVPETIGDAEIGLSGFIHTDDGTYVAGQPDVAATWYPVNDHPLDKASYSFSITVPRGLEAIANGTLEGVHKFGRWATWRWEAREPMASYLTTATIGEFKVDAYKADGIRYWDAMDPDLLVPPKPRTGSRFAISQISEPSYKRLTRTINVPAGGGQLSFWVTRETEPDWDHFFVEAHTVGLDNWTTLRDLNGHNSQEPGAACAGILQLYPFLEHYLSISPAGECTPTGTSGVFWSATGKSDGYEQWRVDLSAFAGRQIELSLTHASDDLFQYAGVEVDDVVGPGGQGTTSFENDGNVFDGWTVSGPPAGSPPNPNDWIAGTSADTPPTLGEKADEGVSREPEITRFLAGIFGPYPFSSSGSIIDDVDGVGFALENQTRPTYSKVFFEVRSEPADSVFVHELAHQWVGDSLAVARWQHIWLNEGFATYTEWLWSEREGRGTAQELFDFYSQVVWPAGDPFWTLTIGDPGPELLFELPVYYRGAMTLHTLRGRIGDAAFFRLLREWIRQNRGGNVTTSQFIALAERISGQQLDDLFQVWLFTPERPPELDAAASRIQSRSATGLRAVRLPDGRLIRVG
jgi:peptidase M1-like protein